MLCNVRWLPLWGQKNSTPRLRAGLQCSTHLSITHYSVVVPWRVIIHILIGLTLIIAVSEWNQLDIDRLGKHGFKSNGFCISDWSRPTVLLFTLRNYLYMLSAPFVLIVLFQFWFIFGSYQLTVQPTHIYNSSSQIPNEARTLHAQPRILMMPGNFCGTWLSVPVTCIFQRFTLVLININIQYSPNKIPTLHKKYCSTTNPSLCDKLTSSESTLREQMTNGKISYEHSLIADFANKHNYKISSYIKSLTWRHTIPSMHLNSISVTSDYDKAILFN